MMSRFVRLLPITIAAGCLLLVVRVGDIWLGVRVGLATTAEAQMQIVPSSGGDAGPGEHAGGAGAASDVGEGVHARGRSRSCTSSRRAAAISSSVSASWRCARGS